MIWSRSTFWIAIDRSVEALLRTGLEDFEYYSFGQIEDSPNEIGPWQVPAALKSFCFQKEGQQGPDLDRVQATHTP